MTTSPRAEAIRLAHAQILTQGNRRAYVFAEIASSLGEGPARVPFTRIMSAAGYGNQAKWTRTPPANVRHTDGLVNRLVADGWLIVTAKPVPPRKRVPAKGPKGHPVPGASPQPREYDLGPAVVRAYASHVRKAG